MVYVSNQDKKGIMSFKYAFINTSLYYNNLMSQICDVILRVFVPPWIAPNVLTLCSFFFVLISHLFVVYTQHSLEQKSLFLGVSLTLYQIFDNLDGKQARKTGNATPLGMLFDHGIDSLINWLIVISFSHLNGINLLVHPTNLLYLYMWIGSAAFFVAQWCFYHTGILVQATINPVDEGLLVTQIACYISAAYGQSFWGAFYYGYEVRYLFVGMAVVGALLQILGHFKRVVWCPEVKFFTLAKEFAYPGILALLIWAVGLFTPELIHSSSLLNPLYYSMGILLSINIIKYMLDRSCFRKFVQFYPAYILYVAVCASAIAAQYSFKIFEGREWMFVAMLLAISLPTFLHFVVVGSQEIAAVLGINILRINKVK